MEIENSSNMIGGPNVGDRNVISGNNSPAGSGDGVYVPDRHTNPLHLTPTGNLIQNNYIGVDAMGSKALANGVGVIDNGAGNTMVVPRPGSGT